MNKHTFLVEIGTEELPPKMLRMLAEAFSIQINNELNKACISYSKTNWFASPRRLAVKVNEINNVQADNYIEKRGPSLSKAFDVDGKFTKECEHWIRSYNIDIKQIQHLITKKGKWLVYRAYVKGQPVNLLLHDIVNRALHNLPIKKMMRWGNKDILFIRPVHSVIMLLDNDIVPGKIFGINSDRFLSGHRFMGKQNIKVTHANEYPYLLLSKGWVIADYLKRKEIIKQGVETAAKKLGGIADISEDLLEEVTSLVEWPVILTANFEKKFLSLPIESLIFIMKNNQKYFPIYNKIGDLLPYFIFVINIKLKDPKSIIIGNERVMHSRLTDAEFFFKADCKYRLEDHLPRLSTVIFQKQLGTLLDRSYRISSLSAWISTQIDANVTSASRAGLLSKCDLMTNMVFEFSEIQGTIGMHYARRDGELEEIALAQKEQYQPRFAGDKIPTTSVSCAVAIADKIDMLTGIIGIGVNTRSDKDPFSLRRAALGILRIIIEKRLSIDLQTLIETAVHLYDKRLNNKDVIANVIDFMFNRFLIWYRDHGYNINVIQSVLALRPTNLLDFNSRIQAVNYFCTLEESTALSIANKRISNILKNFENLNYIALNTAILKNPDEIVLLEQLEMLRKKLKPMLKNGLYKEVLIELSTLRKPIDSFFKNVKILTENHQIKINRLKLLAQLRDLFLSVSDISLLYKDSFLRK